jgi:outer membrane murein-binding lipoprotein Lpp
MKLIKSLIIIWAVYVITGCANISDLENLQAQLDSLKPRIAVLSSDAAISKVIATEADLKSANAEKTANRTAQYAQEMSSKLDFVPCRIPRPKNKK